MIQLDKSFWLNKQLTTEDIAEALIGYSLVHQTVMGVTVGRIVETEAYVGITDLASHSYGGKQTPRLKAMYGAPGHFYVYQMRGLHLLNVVTQSAGQPHGILIRAIEPTAGIDLMLERRHGQTGYNLTNGPGKMTQAMAIDMNTYATSVTEPPVYIDFTDYQPASKIATSPRIGIPNKGEWTDKNLRYFVAGNPYVSKFKGVIAENNGWRL